MSELQTTEEEASIVADIDEAAEEHIDETAEELMTDMKLEDELDDVRAREPDFEWLYHIEIYPWNADDMTESFVRLMKLSNFAQVYMRKKNVEGADTSKPETAEDKLTIRQREGCLHLYTTTWYNTKSIMRSATWKTMTAKVLNFEITRRDPEDGDTETAFLELDTYNASKTRFRDKIKGELKVRSAKVSNLPGNISREFLEVVFSRAYAVIGGTTIKEYIKDKEGNLQQKLQDVESFSGSLDFDCLGKGSCRSFVLAHKQVIIQGETVTVEANEAETMNTPPAERVIPKKDATPVSTNLAAGRGRGNKGLVAGGTPKAGVWNGLVPSGGRGRGRGINREFSMPASRMGSAGRALFPQRPASASFVRPGLPVPMTGRQKMNEKIWRNQFAGGVGYNGAGLGMAGGLQGNSFRSHNPMDTVGASFKHEIATLQQQLEKSTQALEAKIAMLQTSNRGWNEVNEFDNQYNYSGVAGQNFHSSGSFTPSVESNYRPSGAFESSYRSSGESNFRFGSGSAGPSRQASSLLQRNNNPQEKPWMSSSQGARSGAFKQGGRNNNQGGQQFGSNNSHFW